MKSPSKELQTAYFTALNGNISYGGDNVPVYDVVPNNVAYPYIHLQDQIVNVQPQTKDTYITEVIFQIDIVTGFEGAYGGKSQAYDISNDVMDTIINRGSYLSLTNFNLFQCSLDLSSMVTTQTDTHILYINRIRFRNLIEEL